MNAVLAAFQEIKTAALKHEPPEARAALIMMLATCYCFHGETILEAVDQFRSDIPEIERYIRQSFPQIADIAEKVRAARAGR